MHSFLDLCQELSYICLKSPLKCFVTVENVCFLVVPPGPPTPWIVDTGKDFVIVAWKPPLYNGGGDILGYHVEKVKMNIDFTFSATEILIESFFLPF